MIILGVDPGVATTGIGLIEKNGSSHRLISYGAIITPANTPLEDRLAQIYREFTALIDKYQPEVLSIEEVFFNQNVTTAFMVGQAKGVILLAAKQAGIPIHHYTPPQIKTAICGYGKAEKKQVQYMVEQILSLNSTPQPDDAADALAIAICHSHSAKLKSLV